MCLRYLFSIWSKYATLISEETKNNAWVEELKPYSDYVLIVKEDCVIYV